MSQYNAAYLNALSEERNPKILFEWVCKLHRENIDLRSRVKELEAQVDEFYPEPKGN